MVVKDVAVELTEGVKDLPRCRKIINDVVSDMGFAERERWEIVSAVFEACVNAVTHGWGGGYAKLILKPCCDHLEAIVDDHGDGCSTSPAGIMPPPASWRGRGIPLMKSFMDEVKFYNNDGCKVVMVKYLNCKNPKTVR
jgi:serine/threonine-protein kinase RsbW